MRFFVGSAGGGWVIGRWVVSGFFVLGRHLKNQKIQKKGLTEGTAMRYNMGVEQGTKYAREPRVVVKGKASMIYSRLYQRCYPFKSHLDVYALSAEEKECLIAYIKHYPGRIADKLHSAKKYGVPVDGWGRPKATGLKSRFKSRVFPSAGLADVVVKLRTQCDELISKIENEQDLSHDDVDNINRILCANKYRRPLTWFLVPTPDGRVSAVLK